MLGPEGHLYDPLPTPTSIRTLLLAPGCYEDDIFCFLFPCDLDKDHTIDPSTPRPFESLSFARASELGDGDEAKTFMLHVDSYIEDSKEQKQQLPSTSSESAPSRRHRFSTYLKGINRKAQKASEPGKRHDAPSSSERHRDGITHVGAGSTEEDSKEKPSDDIWDLMQLARLTHANGALDSRVRRHPFQRYSALSYVWGSEEAPVSINIDVKTKFRVTKNLYDALKSLRQLDMARTFWIDAICIDQKDPKEKKVQIGLMQRVYRQAQKVIAYVPQTREDTKILTMLFGKIRTADTHCREIIKSGNIPEQQIDEDDPEVIQARSDTSDVTTVRQYPLKPTGTCIEDYDMPVEADPSSGAWRRFFASPYFRRIWILQEYALAQDLYVHLGWGLCKADMIMLVMDAVNYRSRLLNIHYLGRGENAELTRAATLGWAGLEQMTLERVLTRHDIYGSEKIDQKLIDKLDNSMLYDATDPRDKIYALLGLVSDAHHFIDLVSYETRDTPSVICRRFARALIDKGHLTKVLRMAGRTPTNPQLPSWVPDWAAPTIPSLVASISLERGFQAGGRKRSITAYFSPHNEDELIISGYVFSTIACKTAAFVPYGSNPSLSTSGFRLQDFFETLEIILRELGNYFANNFGSLAMELFYILTMQSRRIPEAARPGDFDHKDILDDLRLFRTLMGRTYLYSQIEGRAGHKVEYGAFLEEERKFILNVCENIAGRCLCMIAGGNRLGLVSNQAHVGDSLATFDGMPVPFVLRETSGNAPQPRKVYNIVGDAYVTGVMQGELSGDGKHTGEQITLV